MIFKSNVKFTDSEVRTWRAELKINCVLCDNAFVVICFKTMYNKTIIRFGFCDIRNNQGRGKCYQPKPKAEADNTCLDLDFSGYHKNLIQTFQFS